jgi:hypothetical protein
LIPEKLNIVLPVMFCWAGGSMTDMQSEKQLSDGRSPVALAVGSADVGALRLALREVLTQHHGNIPEELKTLPAWVCWAVTKIEPSGKFNKVPYYPNGSVRRGEQGSSQDRKQLGTFAEAFAAFNRNPDRFAGVGLAMLPDWGLVAFDADRCINNGRIRQDVQAITGLTYCEISPSETGVRAFWRGTAGNGKNPDKGFELYSAKQFVTVTGNRVPNIYTLIGGEIPKLTAIQRQELETVCKSQTAKGAISKTAKLNEAALHDPIYRLLSDRGMIERDMGGGKFSILCPFETGHSDYGRAGGDGDTVYFLPHTDGYAQGHFHCAHASCEYTDSDFLKAIGFYDADFDDLGNGEPVGEKQPFPLIRADELTAKPLAINWLVKDIFERESLNLLFGEPGAGKSLFALDWAFCLAAGIDWHGHRTQQIDVVVIAGEGFAGIRRRLKALGSKYRMNAPTRLFISERPAQLMDARNSQWVADTIKEICPHPGLIIVDTLHRNMEGDENSSQDIGKFINNLDNFLKPLGAAVLIVHHSGHGQKDRSRGSSSIRAAMDGEFSATKEGGAIVLTCHKAKDFEALSPLQFSLKRAELDECDEDGESLTSVYLEYDGEGKPPIKKRKLSARDEAILTSLREAIEEHGIEPTDEIKAKFGGFDSLTAGGGKIVLLDHWRDKAYKRLDGESPETQRKSFKRCRDKLFELGKVADYDGFWWPVYD